MTDSSPSFGKNFPQDAAKIILLATIVQLCASFYRQGIYNMVSIFKGGFDQSLGAAALAVTALNGGQFSQYIPWAKRLTVGANALSLRSP